MIFYFFFIQTNRQKKIGALLQNDLVSILQGEIRKNNINNLVISVSKVNVTSDLSIAKNAEYKPYIREK
jgi:ribosome-binding factor A